MSDVIRQIDVLIRARYPIVYLVTWEEDRALRILLSIARKQKKNIAVWTSTDGMRTVEVASGLRGIRDKGRKPLEALNAILQDAQPCVYILKDFHPYLDDPVVVRHLRDLCHALKRSYKTVVLLSPKLDLPLELEKSVAVVDLPVPSRRLMNDLLGELIRDAATHKATVDLTPDDRERLVSAVLGLTLDEAERVFAQSLARDAKFDAADIDAVLNEKKQIIRKSGLLEYCERDEDLAWPMWAGWTTAEGVAPRNVRPSPSATRAREFGLPAPQAAYCMLGVQGCGKSLTAKAVGQPMGPAAAAVRRGSRLRQPGRVDRRTNIRRAIKVAESVAPAVLWIDEIDKAFSAPERSSAVTDGGTSSRVFGTFVTWLAGEDGARLCGGHREQHRGSLPPRADAQRTVRRDVLRGPACRGASARRSSRIHIRPA